MQTKSKDVENTPILNDEDWLDDTFIDETSLAEAIDFQQTDPYREESDALASELSEVDPNQEQFDVARNPWVRVGLAVGAASLVLGFGLVSAILKRSPQTATVDSADGKEDSLTMSLNADEMSKGAETTEVDQLRSEIALLRQQQGIEGVDRNDQYLTAQRNRASGTTAAGAANGSAASTTLPAQPVVRQPVPASTPAAPTSTPVAMRQPTYTPPRPSPASNPYVAPARPAPAPQPLPVPRSVPAPSSYEPPDPQEAWLEASNAGIYGAMPATETAEPQFSQGAVNALSEPASRYQLKSLAFTTVSDDTSYLSEPVPGLLAPSSAMSSSGVVPMQAVEAKVATPIMWTNPNDQFSIEITQDIQGIYGDTVIPAGSLAIVQPMQVQENGVADLAVVGFDINGQMVAVDYQIFRVRGSDGGPLVAERHGDIGGDIAANDLEMFAVGALGGIGEVLTRPNSTSSTTTVIGSSSTATYGDRSIVGGILAGGTEALTERMGERNAERLDELRSREDIFFLDAGASVQIVVNQDFQL